MKKAIFNKIVSVVILVSLILAYLIFGCLFFQRLCGKPLSTIFGWGIGFCVSGSMEPAVPTGSLLIIHEQDDYQIGDIVAYELDNEVYVKEIIAHRIVSIQDETVTTKGDVNQFNDPDISSGQILGEVRYVIPTLGKFAVFLNQPPVTALLVIIILVLMFMPTRESIVKADESA